MNSAGNVLIVVDQGGYPVNRLAQALAQLGYEVAVEHSMRKALGHLKSAAPDIILAEFNYVTHFRDRISNLEPLLARVQSSMPDTRVIVFLEREHDPHLDKLRARFAIDDALYYPLQMDSLIASVRTASTSA